MTKLFSTLIFAFWYSAAQSHAPGDSDMHPHDFAGNAFPIGDARWESSPRGAVVRLPGTSHLEIEPSRPLQTSQGSLIFWIKPLVDFAASGSHVFLTAAWNGDDHAYLALSDGWWEPAGGHKLYFVLNNADQAFCLIPGDFNYAIFPKDQWTMIAATWDAEAPSYVRLYVDGQKVCDRHVLFRGDRTSVGRLQIGSDQSAADRRGRPADFAVREPNLLTHSMTDRDIYERYMAGGEARVSKWVQALITSPDGSSPARESRIIFDEDAHWASSRAEADATIRRVKRAGFNVYVPCVWDGADALFQTDAIPMAERFKTALAAGYDPLTYLIEAAHRQNIAVHVWFDIARRDTAALSPEFSEGAPPNAFNIQSQKFQRFITDLIARTVKAYDVEGVNLDYVRSVGVCSSLECSEAYRARYRRSLKEDGEAGLNGKFVDSLADWNSTALTAILKGISAEIHQSKPGLPISVDTIPFDQSRLNQGVAASSWLAADIIDSVVYMSYDTPIDVARVSSAYHRLPPGRMVVLYKNFDMLGDKAVEYSGQEAADYVRLTRSLWPGSGVGFYHFPHLTAGQADELKRRVFGNAVEDDWKRRVPP
jgi:hypothetical protein